MTSVVEILQLPRFIRWSSPYTNSEATAATALSIRAVSGQGMGCRRCYENVVVNIQRSKNTSKKRRKRPLWSRRSRGRATRRRVIAV